MGLTRTVPSLVTSSPTKPVRNPISTADMPSVSAMYGVFVIITLVGVTEGPWQCVIVIGYLECEKDPSKHEGVEVMLDDYDRRSNLFPVQAVINKDENRFFL